MTSRAAMKTEYPNTPGAVLPPEERFFTKPEMAALMKVSIRCLSDMMRRGEVSYLKINGRLVRFRLQDVNRRLTETVLVCHGESPSTDLQPAYAEKAQVGVRKQTQSTKGKNGNGNDQGNQ